MGERQRVMSDVELLSPAGNFETALAAFEAGADAVYCGLTEFSARAFADNFTLEDLKNLIRYARASRTGRRSEVGGRTKVYVTFNTVIDEDNLEAAIEQLARLDEAKPDALIVQDIGVARICRKHFPDLELHASTQLVAHNLEGVLAMKELGFKRVVLARELSLAEIASIAKRCGDMELEVFIHGALCYSISGLCLFGAMEKGRSGNRGKCPYCCRQAFDSLYPFSMKDLRLGEDVRKLADAGVASLKIEGRMKSALYVASVTKYYRQILDAEAQGRRGGVTVGDLETVFSRRTTKLYFDGRKESPIDSESLGHLGAEIGVVKRVTKDREGLSWLRFHTARGLEKHDGLQFEAMTDEGRHLGMGIVEMRQAISRRPVFEVNAGVDVEVLLPGGGFNAEAQRHREDVSGCDHAKVLKPGMKIYCSMSNAVKRMFPTPSFRPSDYPGGTPINIEVNIATEGLTCCCNIEAKGGPVLRCEAQIGGELQPAKSPEKTEEGVRKAFSKLGETDYRLGKLTVNDPEKLFAPMSLLNDLRRDLVEKLDEAREKARREKVERATAEEGRTQFGRLDCDVKQGRRVKIRAGQKVPAGEWDEIVVAIGSDRVGAGSDRVGAGSDRVGVGSDRVGVESDRVGVESDRVGVGSDRVGVGSKSGVVLANDPNETLRDSKDKVRLALPVYTAEPDFNKLRVAVKGFLRKGFAKWEASDLATLRMLRELGVADITADWTLYAFNSRALAALSELGVKRFVASPENTRENLQYLAESGYDVEFLTQQSTPLFVSLTEPAAKPSELSVFRRDGLWVTTKRVPRTFETPEGVSTRLDLSWDPE